MNNEIYYLKKRIAELNERIEETQKRLPAHSTKPPIMMELLDLEDEHAELSNKLRELKNACWDE